MAEKMTLEMELTDLGVQALNDVLIKSHLFEDVKTVDDCTPELRAAYVKARAGELVNGYTQGFVAEKNAEFRPIINQLTAAGPEAITQGAALAQQILAQFEGRKADTSGVVAEAVDN